MMAENDEDDVDDDDGDGGDDEDDDCDKRIIMFCNACIGKPKVSPPAAAAFYISL